MIRIVLVRPLGPRNVGSVLRAVANFGPSELFLVAPPKPSILIHPDFVQMSHGVENIADKVRVVPSVADALAECSSSVGFTARKRGHSRLDDWRDVRDDLATRATDPGARLALVFGSEEGGLRSDEIAPVQELVRMPTSDEHTSINLAMSVGIVLSTLFFSQAKPAGADSRTPILGKDRTFLTARAREVFGDKALSDEARRDICAMVDRVFARAPMETRDARAWHLLLRALGGVVTPADLQAED
ncbi:MAG: RNA methyltransferase [Planctomycetota bacterium]